MRKREIHPGLWLDSRRAVYFERTGVLAVADLHWGYAVSHRSAGNLLPRWGDEEIARDLLGLVADYAPREMIWLGDSLHDLAGREPAENFLRESPVPVILVPGNHDRKWPIAKEQSVARGDFFFHHGDLARPVPQAAVEVIGHFHPAFSWYDGAGGRIKLPSLVWGPRRIILPAFSPWAAGSPWNAFVGPDEQLWAIAPQRVFPITRQALGRERAYGSP